MVNKGQHKKTMVAPQDCHEAMYKLGDIRDASLRSVVASCSLISKDWGEGMERQQEKGLLDLRYKLWEV